MKWYVVFKGKCPVVYNNWADCNEQVSGFKGNLYQGFKSKEVEQAYHKYMDHQSRVAMVADAVKEATSNRGARKIEKNIHAKDYFICVLIVVVVI